MRTSLVLSIFLAAAIGGCDQSLTHNMTGTGGTGTGTGGSGGTGGDIVGAGGSGGSVSAVCNTLTAEYESAFSAAETCQVGASGQCQQLYNGSLSGCHCGTYVNDSSALDAIQSAWLAAGCAVPSPPCEILCPAALNTTCVSVDGGSLGTCSYVPGTGGISGTGGDGALGGATGAGGGSATGGTSGAGGSAVDGGISACGALSSEYAAVLIGAKSCTAGASGQCAQLVPSRLGPCGGCSDYVNDSSVLSAIQAKWEAAGCGDVAVDCPLITCPTQTASLCVPGDAGGAVCVAPTLAP
ncbi:MAG TPA: hypothetical protein VKZ18_00430 [Polyangia bacterium]|nr:hypothetical protein [Polyangia bacterium]